MKEQLEAIRKAALESIAGTQAGADLEALRVKYLGKKGELTAVLKQMGSLSAEERTAALCLSRAVFAGQKLVEDGERDAATVLNAMKAIIEAEPLARIDYVKMVDFENIVQVEKIADEPILCAMAVYVGKTRLIDNFIFDPKAE